MIKKTLFLLILGIILTSCLSRIENKGYSFELSDYKVKKGLSSKGEIVRNMGSPTLISHIDNEIFWIYFEEKIRKLLFFKPKVLDRRILILTFDENKIVSSLNNYDLKDENNISFNHKTTKIRNIKKSLVSDIFGNIGQVKPQ
jgi:outer membrane protein assembly factor BamE (lipoprotein component of BamABCDE complex)